MEHLLHFLRVEVFLKIVMGQVPYPVAQVGEEVFQVTLMALL
jgi:hypothetical protein